MEGQPPQYEPGDGESRDAGGIGHLFSRLIDDAERFVRAEINLYRAEAFARLGEAKVAVLLAFTAFFLAQAALIAVLVGLMLILQPLLGAALATLVVVGTALILVAVMVAIAIAKIKKITRVKDGPA